MRRILGTLAAVFVLLFAGLAAAAVPAGGGWSAPEVFDPNTGEFTGDGELTSAGNLTAAVWRAGNSLEVATSDSGGPFSTSLTVARASANDNLEGAAVLNPHGDMAILWARASLPNSNSQTTPPARLFVTLPQPDGRHLPAHALGTSVASQGVLDARGTLTLADQLRRSPEIDVITHRNGGAWRVSQRISGSHRPHDLAGLAIAPDGAGVLLVSDATGHVWALTRSSGTGRFGGFTPITPTGTSVYLVGISASGAHTAVIAWETRGSDGPGALQARWLHFGASHTFAGPVQAITRPSRVWLNQSAEFGLSTDLHGDALLTWEQYSGHTEPEGHVMAARSHAGHPFAKPTVISGPEDINGNDFTGAMGADGEAVVSWDSLSAPVAARVALSPTQPFGPADRLAPSSFSAEPAVAIDATGRATLLWWELGDQTGIDINRFTPTRQAQRGG